VQGGHLVRRCCAAAAALLSGGAALLSCVVGRACGYPEPHSNARHTMSENRSGRHSWSRWRVADLARNMMAFGAVGHALSEGTTEVDFCSAQYEQYIVNQVLPDVQNIHQQIVDLPPSSPQGTSSARPPRPDTSAHSHASQPDDRFARMAFTNLKRRLSLLQSEAGGKRTCAASRVVNTTLDMILPENTQDTRQVQAWAAALEIPWKWVNKSAKHVQTYEPSLCLLNISLSEMHVSFPRKQPRSNDPRAPHTGGSAGLKRGASLRSVSIVTGRGSHLRPSGRSSTSSPTLQTAAIHPKQTTPFW
jgi:hypothetical protein